MKILEKYDQLNLKTKLLFFSLFMAFSISGVLSVIFLWIAGNSAEDNTKALMWNIRETKSKQILSYFETKKTDLLTLSNSYDIQYAFEEFGSGYKKLYGNAGRKRAETYLKEKYITGNPNKIGEKDKLEDALDGSAYSDVHKRYQPFFSNYIKQKRYYDLFFVDLEGNLIYTVFKELDYATNLLSGDYQNTNIARLYRDVRNYSRGQFGFIDFEGYAPSNGDPASFIGTPVFKGDRLIGVLLAQLPIDEINSVMKDDFLGTNGAIYLIGKDSFFRTADHRYPNEGYILKKKNDSKLLGQALVGETGVTRELDYRGVETFVSYGKMSIYGTDFVILAEYDVDAALKSLTEMKWKVFFGFSIVMIVLLVLTYLIANGISRPILEAVSILSSSTREIAATVEQQEKTAQMQSASVNETSTTMAELSASAKHTAEQSANVSSKSREAEESARVGKERVSEMVGSMAELRNKVSIISDQILQLSEKNNQIGGIIGLVSDIANQTNMLALNAAVEAARAGEYGKGFAVVASEIRKLADESKRSADKIQGILTEIRRATDSTVMAAEEGNKRVELSANLGEDVVRAFQAVFDSISLVYTSTEQISLNVKQQSTAISEVVQAMNNLNHGSRETATGITQTKVGIKQVDDATISLKQIVEGKK